jgi:hypothetical protein
MRPISLGIEKSKAVGKIGELAMGQGSGEKDWAWPGDARLTHKPNAITRFVKLSRIELSYLIAPANAELREKLLC